MTGSTFTHLLTDHPFSDHYSTLSNVLRITRKVTGMDENTRWQKLASEFLGTAFLVFVGAGAVAGAFTIVGVLGTAASDVGLGVASYGDATPWYQAFFAEFIGTFLLVFGVFGVIYRKAAPGWAGLAIGMVVFAAIIPVAPTTGASINPARTTGPMIVQQIMGGELNWSQWPVYVIAELAAGVAAAVLFGFIAHTAQDNAKASAPAAVPAEV